MTKSSPLDSFERAITTNFALWLSLSAYLIMTLAFVVITRVWDFWLIDEMFSKAKILAHIDALSAEQRRVHAITTATLDVAYPLAYGTFQAGMAYRFLGRWGRRVAPLSLICMPVDLIEGFAQVRLLTGSTHYIGLKVVATPIKLALFVPGLVFALVACWIACRRALRP
ncbi:MAG: hypothetical protein AAGM22_14425 [Acidobacteriota bacterium]